jgi:hypothetical protein
MSLLEMKRRLDSVPQTDIHAALAEFEAQLIALSQPPKVQHLPATQGESFSSPAQRRREYPFPQIAGSSQGRGFRENASERPTARHCWSIA